MLTTCSTFSFLMEWTVTFTNQACNYLEGRESGRSTFKVQSEIKASLSHLKGPSRYSQHVE